MKTNTLAQLVKLFRDMTEERNSLQSRLQEIDGALGEMRQVLGSTAQSAQPSQARSSDPAPISGGSDRSLREVALEVLREGPKSKEELLQGIQQRGYAFKTKTPLNSLGVILYGKNPKLTKVDGRFALPRGSTDSTASPTTGRRGGRRTMSPEARARIAAAQRARWAAQKGRTLTSNGASSRAPAKPKRRLSPAGRRAIAEAARKRWIAAKAAGKKTL